MIALDGALRRLTVCQLTRDRAENGGGLRPRVWLRLSAAAWGQLDPGWNLTIGRRSQFLLVLGHMKRTQKLLCWGCFPKIDWAPAYVDPGARRSRYRMELKRPGNYLNRNEDALTLQRHILRCPAPEDHTGVPDFRKSLCPAT
jgi:hypothetical protein